MKISKKLAIQILKYLDKYKNFYFPFIIVCKGYATEDDDFVEIEPCEWKIIKENKTPKQKWEEDKKSLRKSINYMCVSCMGDERGVNNDIRNCTAKNCALYEVRPYQ